MLTVVDIRGISFQTAITPEMIKVRRGANPLVALIGTLEKAEFEAWAAQCIVTSQDQGKWVSLILDARGSYENMIAAGFLTETQVDDGWQYELTQLAIEQIYVRQTQTTIRHLEAMLQNSQVAQ